MKTKLDVKKVVGRVKVAQEKLQSFMKNQDWVEEARKYAERQGKEVRKLLTADVGMVKTFLERERKELEKFQKQIPGEVKKFREFLQGQRKELEKILANVGKLNGKGTKKKKARSSAGKKKSSGAKKAASSKSASTSQSSASDS